MELTVLGVGDAFTSCHNHTSFLLESDLRLLIDGPQGLFKILQFRNIQPDSIDGIILTHIHGDHSAGVVTLLLWNRYFRNKKTSVFTSREVYEDFKNKIFPSFRETFEPSFHHIVSKSIDDYIDFRELNPDQANPISESLSLEYRSNWHPVPTLGIRLTGKYGTVSISGDTCFNPVLLERLKNSGQLEASRLEKLAGGWLWEADIVYHEVTDIEGSAHTYLGDLENLPADIRRKIRLVHFPDGFESKEIKIAEEGEKLIFSSAGIRFSNLSGRSN